MLLTRDQLLKVEKRKFKVLEVEELGGSIRLASLSAGAGIAINRLQLGGGGGDQREMSIVMFESSVVDDKGDPLFDHDSAGAFLDRISAETMRLIATEITALSGRAKPVVANGATGPAEETPAANPSSGSLSESLPTA